MMQAEQKFSILQNKEKAPMVSIKSQPQPIEIHAASTDYTWQGLYKVGGVAALLAGAIFRRNLGAEISLFSTTTPPDTVIGWFVLLQKNKLLGLAYLNLFDIINYALVALMFLALCAVLQQANKSAAVISIACALAGTIVYFASNTAFSMLSLSAQYTTATTDVQRAMLLAAGQAMLVINDLGVSGSIYISLFLLATAGMLISITILQSNYFNKGTAYVGILANAFDLVYCLAFPFVPVQYDDLIAISTIPAAGLLLMIWHILTGLRLYQIGANRSEQIQATICI